MASWGAHTLVEVVPSGKLEGEPTWAPGLAGNCIAAGKDPFVIIIINIPI